MRAAFIACLVATVTFACSDERAANVDAAELPIDAPAPSFGAVITLSDPGNGSFLPALATRGNTVLVAWHDFAPGGTRIVTTTIVDGVAGPLRVVPETLAQPKRPTAAATAAGFVLAWDAVEGSTNVARTIAVDPAGAPIGVPETISAPGAAGMMVRVTAAGDDVVYAWTDGTAHHFARRGPVETVAATPVGTTLLSGGLLNYPRVALASDGSILLAYRDGGSTASEWDVLLATRPIGGNFGAAENASNSPGLLSDDISLAVEADGRIHVVWVEQDPSNVDSFEVTYVTRDPTGARSTPTRFGTQGVWSWTPSAAPGLAVAWYTGTGAGAGAGGDLWLSTGGAPPERILPTEVGGAVALGRTADGTLHLVFVTPAAPRQVRYASRAGS